MVKSKASWLESLNQWTPHLTLSNKKRQEAFILENKSGRVLPFLKTLQDRLFVVKIDGATLKKVAICKGRMINQCMGVAPSTFQLVSSTLHLIMG